MATYSALPATLNLVATVGNDFTLSLTVTESGSPWVATGATLATDIIDSSGTVVATDFTTAASTGSVTLSLTDTQTGTLGVGVYSYRLSVTKSSLTRDWIAGTLSIVEAGVGGSSTSSASLSISNSAVSLSLTSLVAPLAANISVADAGGLYAATDVEGALAEVSAGSLSRLLPQIDSAFTPGTNNRAAGQNSSYNVIGFDTVNTINGVAAPYCIDAGNGFLRLCLTFDANGAPATWSNAKGFPSGTQWYNGARILTYQSNLYYLTVEDSSGLPAVYKATPTSGSTALTWTKVLNGSAGSGSQTPRGVTLTSDASYIYFGDYGDPTGGPKVYRSSDGTTWSSVKTFTGIRHIHALSADPYNPGTLWAVMGDGVASPNQYSTDYGATWTVLSAQNGGSPQCTDISFTASDVWLADDASYLTAVVVDNATKTWKGASMGYHGNIAVPAKYANATWDPASIANGASTSTTVTLTGARVGHVAVASFSVAVPAGASMTAAVTANDTITVTLTNNTGSVLDLGSGTLRAGITGGVFSPALFYGQIDPATGIFYCVTPQSFGTPDVGLFAIFGKGAPPILLDWGPFGNYGVFISGGRVYYGTVNRRLISVASNT